MSDWLMDFGHAFAIIFGWESGHWLLRRVQKRRNRVGLEDVGMRAAEGFREGIRQAEQRRRDRG